MQNKNRAILLMMNDPSACTSATSSSLIELAKLASSHAQVTKSFLAPPIGIVGVIHNDLD